jgi:hypothetical protein
VINSTARAETAFSGICLEKVDQRARLRGTSLERPSQQLTRAAELAASGVVDAAVPVSPPNMYILLCFGSDGQHNLTAECQACFQPELTAADRKQLCGNQRHAVMQQ